ncbi:DUF3307 domain-containing protein [Methanimicrococcus stummii]|nr:DUF3307 domain-containing protein [Methanimicrococcus sp. Es2]
MLLLCHFIGDYYLQTNKMARIKENNIRNTIIHSILYAVPFIFFLLGLEFSGSLNLMTTGIVIGVVLLHAVIDLIKCVCEKKLNVKQFENESDIKRTGYIADQILHLIVVVTASFLLSGSAVFEISSGAYMLLKCLLFIVIISKPVNISFKKIFEKYQPTQKSNENLESIDSISGAGAIIGTLERLVMGIFIGIGQFAALGLVVAAKSIARYDQISKNKLFAEYFLIGTLYSVLAVLVVYYIIFVVLA